MIIQESGEDYLETILILSKKLKNVRSIDIANDLGYSKPTISVTMKQFRENGLVLIDENGYITLTEAGHLIAKRTYEKHNTLIKFLKAIGVSEENAAADACKIEHDLSRESFNCIKKYYKENFNK